jgi:hypothetical protein
VDLRELPGLPPADLNPPVVAEAGDAFAELRIVHLVARLPRGEAARVRDIVDRLNHEHLDWSFSRGVVVSAIVQLQANWRADYRDHAGMRLEAGPAGEELVIETSSRVDPWMIRQVERLRATCQERLRAFALEEGAIP